MTKKKVINDIEVLNVNKDLIKAEQCTGFKIKKSELWVTLKKIPSNIYKLVVILLASLGDVFANVTSKIPGIGYGVDFIRSYAENFVAQLASDECFDKIICPLVGLPVDKNNFDYLNNFWEFTHHEGKYFQLSLTIKAIATFVMEHPALVLAGGALLVGVLYKLVSFILKKMARRIQYNDLGAKQKEVYKQIESVLKKQNKIRKIETGKVLINDLKISYDIIGQLGNHSDMLNKISSILSELNQAIETDNYEEIEKCRTLLESSVYMFEQENDNLLKRTIHLEPVLVKTK